MTKRHFSLFPENLERDHNVGPLLWIHNNVPASPLGGPRSLGSTGAVTEFPEGSRGGAAVTMFCHVVAPLTIRKIKDADVSRRATRAMALKTVGIDFDDLSPPFVSKASPRSIERNCSWVGGGALAVLPTRDVRSGAVTASSSRCCGARGDRWAQEDSTSNNSAALAALSTPRGGFPPARASCR